VLNSHLGDRSRSIHRDVKLENVMRNISTGRIKLIDFGMARVLEGFGDQTSRIGSRRYMAPEVTDRRARYTVKADVSELGSAGVARTHARREVVGLWQ
jgi:serine/threonine protein kinase